MGYKLKESILTSSLCSELGVTFVGLDCEILGVAPLSDQAPGFLTFSRHQENLEKESIGICAENRDVREGVTVICSDNPRFDFIRALSYLAQHFGFSSYDFPAEIHESARIGLNVVIEPGCIIGENVVIEHNSVIHSGTTIGANSRIRSSANIGGDGFGFERFQDSTPIRFPHLAGVAIGEYVEVGSFTAIARGTLSNTVIEDYVKIDNLVHVAHNCHIKRGAFLIACAEISGGVIVGENAWIAPNSCINQKLSIGANSIVGLGAVVTKNVPESTVYAGNPARKLKDIQ